jgi:hypothetical protein
VEVRDIVAGEAEGMIETAVQLATRGLLLENCWTAVGCCVRGPEVGCPETARLDRRRPSFHPTINIMETCVLWLNMVSTVRRH